MVLKPNRPFVFEGLTLPDDDEIKPMGHNAMAHALKAVKPGYTPHGLRSSFRDWVGEETEYPRELAEHALAHTLGDDSERAYRRMKAVEHQATHGSVGPLCRRRVNRGSYGSRRAKPASLLDGRSANDEKALLSNEAFFMPDVVDALLAGNR